MIVADRKSIPEIMELIKDYDRVLLVGCGTCVTVCLAGGEREVSIMGSALRMALKLNGRADVVVDECTIERQCDEAFFDELVDRVGNYDVVCSLGCGVGVQGLADRFTKTPIVPALDTKFMGLLQSQGVWVERCAGCGKCRLGEFVGVCPIANCAKHIFNGPCGGSNDGKCEVDPDTECAWQKIYDKAKELGMLDKLEELAEVQDWSTGHDGGPRKVVRKDQYIDDKGSDA